MKLVFFGTPEFAVPALRALMGEAFDVAAVVTQPDRPQGRSRSTLIPPPVKVTALEEDLPVLQPERPTEPAFLEAIRRLAPDLGVVVAYGHILRPELLAIPRLGLVNVHASLLPAFRGAAPIQHAIMEGATETGVSIMQLDEGMDTGPVFLRVPTPIASDETAGELTARLAELGAFALIEALTMLSADAIRPEPQDNEQATYAPKITTEMARIRWEEPAERIGRLIRALDPRPGAWTELRGRRLKIFGPRTAGDLPTDALPGQVVAVEPAFVVATGDGALQLLEVQPEGGARLGARAWLRGRPVDVGGTLG